MYETQQNIGLLFHLTAGAGDERMHPSAAGLKRLKV